VGPDDQGKTVVKLRFKRVLEAEAGVETLETWSVEQVLRFFERRKFPTEGVIAGDIISR
jgi:hypothetical protein